MSSIITYSVSESDQNVSSGGEAAVFTKRIVLPDPKYSVIPNDAGFCAHIKGTYRYTIVLFIGEKGGIISLFKMPPSPSIGPWPNGTFTVTPNTTFIQTFNLAIPFLTQLQMLAINEVSILRGSSILLELLS